MFSFLNVVTVLVSCVFKIFNSSITPPVPLRCTPIQLICPRDAIALNGLQLFHTSFPASICVLDCRALKRKQHLSRKDGSLIIRFLVISYLYIILHAYFFFLIL